jgi:hypothetical protein
MTKPSLCVIRNPKHGGVGECLGDSARGSSVLSEDPNLSIQTIYTYISEISEMRRVISYELEGFRARTPEVDVSTLSQLKITLAKDHRLSIPSTFVIEVQKDQGPDREWYSEGWFAHGILLPEGNLNVKIRKMRAIHGWNGTTWYDPNEVKCCGMQ